MDRGGRDHPPPLSPTSHSLVLCFRSLGNGPDEVFNSSAGYGRTLTDEPRVWQVRSVIRNVVRLATTMPFARYSSYNDSMIPITVQTRRREALVLRRNPLLFATILGDHVVDELSAGFAFVLNRRENH